MLIVRDLAVGGARTYSDLLNGWEGISTNILAKRLGSLEQHGVIARRADPENWRSQLISLTDKGRALAPVLAELVLWGGAYNPSANPMTETVDKVANNRAEFENAIRKGTLP